MKKSIHEKIKQLIFYNKVQRDEAYNTLCKENGLSPEAIARLDLEIGLRNTFMHDLKDFLSDDINYIFKEWDNEEDEIWNNY